MKVNRKLFKKHRADRERRDLNRRSRTTRRVLIGDQVYWLVSIKFRYHAMKTGRRGYLVPVGLSHESWWWLECKLREMESKK